MGFVMHPEYLQNCKYLRRLDYILVGYIDDIINVGNDFSDCLKKCFVVHLEKSKFLPSRDDFLGLVFDSNNMTIRLTDVKKKELFQLCAKWLELASVLGKFTRFFQGLDLDL